MERLNIYTFLCLFNVKDTLTQQSKWMKTLQTKHLQWLMSTRPLYSHGPSGSTSFSGHGRQRPVGGGKGGGCRGGRGAARAGGDARPCWLCCLCEKRRSVHLQLAQVQRDLKGRGLQNPCGGGRGGFVDKNNMWSNQLWSDPDRTEQNFQMFFFFLNVKRL